MFSEAGLSVSLRIRDDRVAAVLIRSTRMVQAARLFAKRPPAEVLHLLPAVFSLCGTAQAMTGLNAMEKAAAITASSAQKAARALLVLAETVTEHGLTIARDWPVLAGGQPRLDHAKRIRGALAGLRGTLFPQGDWLSPGGGTLVADHDRIRTAIDQARQSITQLLGHDIGELVLPIAFQAWLERDPAHLPGLVQAKGWAGIGAGPFLPMPELGPPDLAARMATDRDGQYLARPDCAGRVFETGSLAHWSWHPLISDLMDRHGAGLLPRLAARLVALAEGLREMEELVRDLKQEPACSLPGLSGEGLALTEAARGLLAHRVVLKDGKISQYQILAPTEWNFHPEGPLVRALHGLPAGPDLEWQARLLVNALDPCVACAITQE